MRLLLCVWVWVCLQSDISGAIYWLYFMNVFHSKKMLELAVAMLDATIDSDVRTNLLVGELLQEQHLKCPFQNRICISIWREVEHKQIGCTWNLLGVHLSSFRSLTGSFSLIQVYILLSLRIGQQTMYTHFSVPLICRYYGRDSAMDDDEDQMLRNF